MLNQYGSQVGKYRVYFLEKNLEEMEEGGKWRYQFCLSSIYSKDTSNIPSAAWRFGLKQIHFVEGARSWKSERQDSKNN